MTYLVQLHHQAEKALDRLDQVTAGRILGRLDQLAKDPVDKRISNEVKMNPGRRYAKVGDWRIIYQIDEEVRVVIVTAIQHRSKAYRKP